MTIKPDDCSDSEIRDTIDDIFDYEEQEHEESDSQLDGVEKLLDRAVSGAREHSGKLAAGATVAGGAGIAASYGDKLPEYAEEIADIAASEPLASSAAFGVLAGVAAYGVVGAAQSMYEEKFGTEEDSGMYSGKH